MILAVLKGFVSINMLTNTEVKNLKPKENCLANRPDKYSDGNGLQLWVRSTGKKTWVSAYRYNEKQSNITLGSYPEISLAEARELNQQIRLQLTKGLDPKQEKRLKKLADQNVKLFNDYALAWLENRKMIVKPRTYQQDFNRLHKDVLPAFKGIGLEQVTFEDCKALAQSMESRKHPDGTPPREVTRRTIALIEQIFKHAKIERLIQHSPVDGIKDLYPKAKTKHMKHVELEELPKLLQAIDQYHGHEQTRLGMKFLAYSFCRTIELRMMKWEHIDFINKLWRVDVDNLKVARKHVVPLSRQMLEVLEELKQLTGRYEYVFFNTGTNQPYSEEFINNALDILGYAGKQTGHGFRHIASTNLNELGYMGDAIEKQLAHDKRNNIRAVYNHAQHLEERRRIMQVWADFLDLLRDTGKVPNLQQARRQIENSLDKHKAVSISDMDTDTLLEELKKRGVEI